MRPSDSPWTERCLHYLENSYIEQIPWKSLETPKIILYKKNRKWGDNGPWMQMRDLWEFGRWTVIKGDEIVSRLYDFIWCESRWRDKTKYLKSSIASDNFWGWRLFFDRNYLSALSIRKTKKSGIKIIEIKMWRH